MSKKTTLFHTFLFLILTLPVFSQTLPGTGELDKTDWTMTKDDVAASLSARVKATAVITADKISYAAADFTQGLLSDGAQYLFTKTGALQETDFLRTFNLEKEKTAQFFQDFATAAIEQYTKKLGPPDVDTVKTAGPSDAPVTAGAVVWQATAERPFRLEILVVASGTLVFYSESCINAAAH